MKVLIIASARRERHLLREEALAAGHQVTVLQRKVGWFGRRTKRFRKVEGDVSNAALLTAAMTGQDAVICWLKPTRKTITFLWESTANVVRAMQKYGARRLICVSACDAGDSRGHCGFWRDRVVQPLFLRKIYEDRDRQEELVSGTDPDWLIVRPAKITGGKATGQYLMITDLKNFKASKISLADLVDFVTQQLTNDFYLRQAPVITYGE